MNKKTALLFFLLFLAFSCADFEVENLNAPDSSDILTYEYITEAADDLYKYLCNMTHDYLGPSLYLAVMADQLTTSWCSFSTFGSEPRTNKELSSYSLVNTKIWNELYNTFNIGSDILKFISIDNADKIPDTDKRILTAWANFNMGISLGYIALLFDQGFIMTDNSDSSSPDLKPWNDLVPIAIRYLDRCTEICSDYHFDIPYNYISGANYSSRELAKLSNTYAARIMTYSPRNASQNDTIDWTKVLLYATKGIDFDHNIELNRYDWIDVYKKYCCTEYWFRIDNRIINLLDPEYPNRWPWDGIWPEGIPQVATSSDARLLSDFSYMSTIPFVSVRGYYRFSFYYFSRYLYLFQEEGFLQGYSPYILKWENDLIIAEALVRANNDLAGALAILNNPAGARKSRGELADLPVGSSVDNILDAIFYEREIELIATGMGVPSFDMRRRDMLQTGSLLHFPIPESECNILGIDYYTFGGVENADGINTSNGGWF